MTFRDEIFPLIYLKLSLFYTQSANEEKQMKFTKEHVNIRWYKKRSCLVAVDTNKV